MTVLNVPKEGINHIRPSIKLGQAVSDHAGDDGCHRDMESVPVRNPLFDDGKVAAHVVECPARCLWASEGHAAIFPSSNGAVWLLSSGDICVSYIGNTSWIFSGREFGCGMSCRVGLRIGIPWPDQPHNVQTGSHQAIL